MKLGRLYLVIAILYLIPIWSVAHLPTADGPSHVYNSWILRELIAGNSGPISRYFEIDWRPHPNWIGHALLALLMTIAPPVMAEKIFFSAIVLLFFASLWLYSGKSPYAFFAFPFAYHQFLQTGFYNFSVSIALYFLILGMWWKRRDSPNVKNIALMALLLIVCYFSHPMSTLLAIGSIGLLWLLALRGRKAAHLLAFVPLIPLLGWFAWQRKPEAALNSAAFGKRLAALVRIDSLFTFDFRQFQLGYAMFGLLVVLSILTAIRERRRDVDAFVVITLVFIIIYFFAPDDIAGGMAVAQRMSLFIYLLLLPWFTPSLTKPLRIGLIALLSVLAIGNLLYLTRHYRAADRYLTQFLRSLKPITPETTLLPLLFNREMPDMFISPYSHLVDYVAIERRLVDFDNYEAATGYFPIRFKPGIPSIPIYSIEAGPAVLPIAPFAPRAQYIFTWQMPEYSPIEKDIEAHYRRAYALHGARVYRSLSMAPPMAASPMILLPIAGTAGEKGGWRVDQFARNGGQRPAHLILSTCVASCEVDLPAGEQISLASADDQMPFIFAYLTNGDLKRLSFSTTVSFGSEMLTTIPTVQESDFRRRKIRIANVPFGGMRLNLRAWFLGEGTNLFFIHIFSREGRLLGNKLAGIDPTAFFTEGDLSRQFPQISPQEFVDVEIDTQSDDLRVWAFITATDYHLHRIKLYLPM
ncbi:MAG TPA: hypothetical protein VER58_14180 [Thermoanaerobaculia bacterium]|nr:hypothetical protein [Thermoanaerobaculia bacterium]